MMNIGQMKVAAIGMYREFMMKIAVKEEEGYRRYKGLEDFLGGESGIVPAVAPSTSKDKSAAEDDEERARGERQQQRYVGQRGIGEKFGQMFRDMLEEHLPGGYFDDPEKTGGWGDKDIRALTDDFYRMAYKGFDDLLPKLIAERLKEEKIHGVSQADVQVTPELVYKVISDALIYFQEHPDEIRGGLVRAYTKKFGQGVVDEGDSEDDGKKKDKKRRELGVGQVFFRPKVDNEYYEEMRKKSEATGEEPELSVGDVDSGVLRSLERAKESREPVKWKWVGIDENGMLTFTLPELYKRRKFLVKLPSDVGYIRPGTYSMVVRQVRKNGAVLEFTDQKQEIFDRYMGQVGRVGLGADQLRSFINNSFVNGYVNYLRYSKPIEELLEDFGGMVTVGGEQIGSVDDLGELGEGDKEIPKARGSEEIEEAYRQSIARYDALAQDVVRKWEGAPEVQQKFLSMTPQEGMDIADAVAEKYPVESKKGTIGLQSLLGTRSVVHFIMRTIMDPHHPIEGAGGKADPWIATTINHIRNDAVKDPALLKQFTALMQATRGRKEKSTLGVPVESVAPTVAEVQAFINAIPESTFRARLKDLKDSPEVPNNLRATILSLAGHPALKRFFERSQIAKSYMDKQVARFVSETIYLSELDPSDPQEAAYRKSRGKAIGVISPETLPHIDPESPEGRAILDRQIKAFIGRTVKRMEQPGLSVSASTMDPVVMHQLMVHSLQQVHAGRGF